MYALLDWDEKTVIGAISPDKTVDEILEIANGRTVITMTLENSPAYLNGSYVNGKFYPPEGYGKEKNA